MRLVNTTTLKLKDFSEDKIPQYAILSHRWEGKETTFKTFDGDKGKDSAGHRKIAEFCKVAARDKHKWVWIDTCCLDKRSSAELSEAVNSMFQWYENAVVCYAYLSDTTVIVPSSAATSENDPKTESGVTTTSSKAEGFKESRWFTRGWTLQELIAPKEVVFLDRQWIRFGIRSEMAAEISQFSGIPEVVLNGPSDVLLRQSVGERMSWASKRTTTRAEDIAYSLLGIFDINMPVLYGEGKKAFYRLQEAIAKQSNDMSLFAWTFNPDAAPAQSPVPDSSSPDPNSDLVPDVLENNRLGAFASSPQNFQNTKWTWWYEGSEGSRTSSTYRERNWLSRKLNQPYEVTNRGLRVNGCILDTRYLQGALRGRVLVLNCCSEQEGPDSNTNTTRLVCLPLTTKIESSFLNVTLSENLFDDTDHIHYRDSSAQLQFLSINTILSLRRELRFTTFYLHAKPGLHL